MTDTARFPFMWVSNALGESVLRPLIPVTFFHQGNSQSASALLDTGADINVMPYSLGTSLGAIWEEQTLALDLSGNLSRYEARGLIVSVVIGNFEPVQLAFAWTQAEHAPLILGQLNFFDEFDVCFLRRQNRLEIQKRA